MDTNRIVFSGSGGQGVITAAIILSEAAVLHEGLDAVQTQVYGPEARGGATRADVIISQNPIYYPKVLNPNILVCLTQEAYNRFSGVIWPGGLLLTDVHYVKKLGKIEGRHVALNMYQAVMKRIGKPIVFNVCMLGALIGLTHLVRSDSVMKVLASKVDPDFIDVNQEALELGLELAVSPG